MGWHVTPIGRLVDKTGQSISALAREAGVSESVVRDLVAGRYTWCVTPHTATRLARVMKVSPERLRRLAEASRAEGGKPLSPSPHRPRKEPAPAE